MIHIHQTYFYVIFQIFLQDKIFNHNNLAQMFLSKEKEREIISLEQIDSKILSMDQKEYLLKQLNNPTWLRLLFRASQHNFSATKFHEYCDNISNTVTIVRTEFGKTVAAFTALKWKASSSFQNVADDSKSSFLLQLDLKQKMTLVQPQYAICNNLKYGPTFGIGYDLHISNQCNRNQKSYAITPHSYNYKEKRERNQETYTMFCGSPNGHQFKVVQYEVFVASS